MEQKVKVCERVADQMGAAGYVVMTAFNEMTNELENYVFENQFNSWKASFNSY